MNVKKSFWFLMVMCLCSVSFGQLMPPLMPVPDPISTPGAEQLPTCEELESFANAYSIIINVLTGIVADNQAALDAARADIMQNDMNIYAAIAANAPTSVLNNLKTNGEALVIVRNVRQATLTANQASLGQAQMNFMDIIMQIMMGACQ